MSVLFLEKAFWGFLALVAALIAVIYRLFNGGLNKDLDLRESKLESRLEKQFNEKCSHLESQMESLKNHENNNAKMQIRILRQVLSKLDKQAPTIFENLDND